MTSQWYEGNDVMIMSVSSSMASNSNGINNEYNERQ